MTKPAAGSSKGSKENIFAAEIQRRAASANCPQLALESIIVLKIVYPKSSK